MSIVQQEEGEANGKNFTSVGKRFSNFDAKKVKAAAWITGGTFVLLISVIVILAIALAKKGNPT